MVELSHEVSWVVFPVELPLFVGTLAELELSPPRPEAALGDVDCDSLFRHTFILHRT
jgi:hypothetical protein